MAKLIVSNELDLDAIDIMEQLQIYNGLDTMITEEVRQQIEPQLTGSVSQVYQLERNLQGPFLDAMLRGVRIDMGLRATWMSKFQKQWDQLQSNLNKLTIAIWHKPLNINSPKQLQDFFYNTFGLPEYKIFQQGKMVVTTNREALEHFRAYLSVRPICNIILKMRDIGKKLSVLRTAIDDDKRIRASYNIAGTETGRLSSSTNAFGTGTNLQNITEELRRVFIADPGYKLAYIDLEQAESRAVAWIIWILFNDPTYLDTCESGDLHTTVCRMIWSDLGWNNDPKHDRKIADQIFYRHMSYRDMSKRGGHGTNYYGKPHTMAKHLNVDTDLMRRFQNRYFEAFPGIPAWHQYVKYILQTEGVLTTFMGRRRQFFGCLNNDSTLREAIAMEPQSAVGDLMNLGILRMWKKHGTVVHLLGQVHDAALVQYPEELESELIPQIQDALEIPMHHNGRTLCIPTEAATGWNWAYASDSNPDGLKKWKGNDSRIRQHKVESSLLDRRFY